MTSFMDSRQFSHFILNYGGSSYRSNWFWESIYIIQQLPPWGMASLEARGKGGTIGSGLTPRVQKSPGHYRFTKTKMTEIWATNACYSLMFIHNAFSTVAFFGRQDKILTREFSLVPLISSLREKSHS